MFYTVELGNRLLRSTGSMSRRVVKLDFARTHSWKYVMWGTIQKPQTSTIQYWAGSLREKAGLQGERLEHSETQKGTDRSNSHISSDDEMCCDDYGLHENGVWWCARALEPIAIECG